MSQWQLGIFCIFIHLTVVQAQDTSGEQVPKAGATAQGEEEKQDGESYDISKVQQYFSPFEYDPEKFRDPFEPQVSGDTLSERVYGPFLESQNHKLSNFVLKGLIWKTQTPVAIFRGPGDREYRLRIKDYIGENFGYIATIREKEVVVIQTVERGYKRYSMTKVIFLED